MDQNPFNIELSEPDQPSASLGIEQHALSDAELLELFHYSRSATALSEIVRRHSPLVASVIRRLISNSQDAEDAFQATFLVLVLSVKKIRNPDSLGAWLYGVAYRTAKRVRSMRRKNNLKMALQSTVGIDLDASQSPVEEPLAIIARELQLEAMDEEMSKLPKPLRDALIEHYLGGNSVPEIARCLNLSVTAVEGRLKRGRKVLRTRLAMRGISLSVIAAACLRFQKDVVAASAEPWSNRFIELYGNAGVGQPTIAQLQDTESVSTQLIKLVQGEVVVNILSRSMLGVAGGALVLCAIGTLGFMAASANQQGSLESRGSNGNLPLTPGKALPQDSGNFVLAQGMMGMGGGGMGGMQSGVNAPKELVIKWEKPTAPVPPWLEGGSDPKERENDVRRSLKDRMDIELNGTPISGAMSVISKKMGIPIFLDDKALEDENITPDEPITIARKDAKVRDVLMQILDPLQLTYVIEYEVIRITSKKTSANQVRYYDLSFIFPDNGLTSELMTSIEMMVAPDQWQVAGGTSSMVTVGSMLVISAPEETQLAIEVLLREIGKQTPANLKPRVFLDKPASKPAEIEKAVEKR